MTTVREMVTANGKEYEILVKQKQRIIKLVEYANSTMKYPCVYHCLSWINEPKNLDSRNLIKNFKRALKRQYKSLKQQCPNVLVAYSIEFKYTSQQEIDGIRDYLTSENNLPFLHLHFYVIADCSECLPHSFPKYAMGALNNIKGLSKARYFKSDKYVYSFSNQPVFTKLDNDSLDDVCSRMKYIAKLDQKSDEIPFTKTFGTSQIKPLPITSDDSLQQVGVSTEFGPYRAVRNFVEF